MKEFDLDLLINKKAVVNCRTEDEAIEFISYLWVNDIKWCDGMSLCSSGAYRYSKFLYETCFVLDNMGLSFSDSTFYKKNGYEILCLSDLLMAQETKPKNNFKDYGFEADFEGEILKEYENQFVGMVYQNEANFGCSWDKKGRCLQPNGFGYINMNLKPIKKEWYENPDNFPCIIISLKTNKPHIAYNYSHLEEKIKQETFSAKPDKFRPATKEEVLSLLIKE